MLLLGTCRWQPTAHRSFSPTFPSSNIPYPNQVSYSLAFVLDLESV